jgi:hypothetical protein
LYINAKENADKVECRFTACIASPSTQTRDFILETKYRCARLMWLAKAQRLKTVE